jgi:hypothetical protein
MGLLQELSSTPITTHGKKKLAPDRSAGEPTLPAKSVNCAAVESVFSTKCTTARGRRNMTGYQIR